MASTDVENQSNGTKKNSTGEVLTTTTQITTFQIDDKQVEYDPYEHRNVEHPTSNLDTAIHLLKGNIGTGILAMPEAFKNAGLFAGSIGLGLIGIICVHTMHLLLDCSRILTKRTRRPYLNFAEVGELSFRHGPHCLRPLSGIARIVIDMFLCATQLGFCCVYYVFVATNLQVIIKEEFNHEMSVNTYLSILLLPLIFLNWIRNLKFLSPVMSIANVFMSIGLGIIFYYIFQDMHGIYEERPDFHVVFASWAQIPLYFGTALYAFEGIGMILPLENKMRTPQDFGGLFGVLNISMFIVGLTYLAVGFFGYLKYGADSVGSITLNLPEGQFLAMSVRIVMAASIFLSYALQFYIPISLSWPFIESRIPKNAQTVSEIVYRTVLVVVTYAIAVLIPNLGLVISLVGALCTSALGLILPPIFSILTRYEDVENGGYGAFRWRLIKDLLLLVFGLVGCSTGTYVSVLGIINFDESNPHASGH